MAEGVSANGLSHLHTGAGGSSTQLSALAWAAGAGAGSGVVGAGGGAGAAGTVKGGSTGVAPLPPQALTLQAAEVAVVGTALSPAMSVAPGGLG